MHKIRKIKIQREKETQVSRRSFLKKSVYSAPLLMSLGQLVKPKNLYADGTGGPEGPPDDFFSMSSTSSSSSNPRTRDTRPTRSK